MKTFPDLCLNRSRFSYHALVAKGPP